MLYLLVLTQFGRKTAGAVLLDVFQIAFVIQAGLSSLNCTTSMRPNRKPTAQ